MPTNSNTYTFFRADYVWVNDENSLRKEGEKIDPYSLFQKRLKSGYPPDDLQSLCRECFGDKKREL